MICAGFISRPIGSWSWLAQIAARPWFFTLKPPRFVLEHFLLGEKAPPELIQQFRQTLNAVRPETLSGRVYDVLACDARSDLARMTVPIMYLRASLDRLLSKSCHKEILRIKPDVKLVTIEAPHMLLQREPQKVAELVAAFLANS